MSETVIHVRLNQQQLELIDRSVKHLKLANREELLRIALHEYAQEQDAVEERNGDE
jgi:metal-responsive CopG/Arc/MetJ family transcriptional regulator